MGATVFPAPSSAPVLEGWTDIASVTTAALQATISFLSIPAGYKKLWIISANLRLSASDGFSMKINNDSGANYATAGFKNLLNGSAVQGNGNNNGLTYITLNSGSDANGNVDILLELVDKPIHLISMNGAGVAGRALHQDTVAISRLDLLAGASTFANGGTVYLKGQV
jgi:hypothetical protein